MNEFSRYSIARRMLLSGGIALAGAAAIPAFAKRTRRAFFDQQGHSLGAQLFPVSAEIARDLEGTFARLSRMGYKTIETSGFHGYKPGELRAAADRAGLKIVSVHVMPQVRLTPTDHPMVEDIEPLISDLHTLGVHKVVMPLMLLPSGSLPKPGPNAFAELVRTVGAFTPSDWQRTAAFLNDRGGRFRQAGIQLHYHNHNMEFAPVGGTTGWDILMRGTDPSQVCFELDIGWVQAAGIDPVDLLNRHPGRIRMLHLKEIDARTKSNFRAEQISAPAGSGTVNWVELLHAADAHGVTDYFVEQEPPFVAPPLDAMEQSIAYLRRVI